MRLVRLFAALAALVMLPFAAQAEPVTVFAAASLGDALPATAKIYKVKTGKDVVFSFAASSVLAKQIESSGGADIFISADEAWMDYLEKAARIAPGTREDLLGNSLVMIAPTDSPARIDIKPGFDLLGALNGGRLAVADTDTVPAGRYAKEALAKLGIWDSVSAHLAPAENVRVALAYVARGEAPLGIVYSTDAKIEPSVKIVAVFPETSHAPIVYPAAVIAGARPGAADFLAFLKTVSARAVFEQAGFTVKP